jgi:hypothetical protein
MAPYDVIVRIVGGDDDNSGTFDDLRSMMDLVGVDIVQVKVEQDAPTEQLHPTRSIEEQAHQSIPHLIPRDNLLLMMVLQSLAE